MTEENKTTSPDIDNLVESDECACTQTEKPDFDNENYADNFVLESDVFNQDFLTGIVLPKFMMAPSGTVKEQSYLLLTFEGVHCPSVYADVLRAIKDGIKKFEIYFLDEEFEEIVSDWKFEGVRIHAVDFGYIARCRDESAEISVELHYDSLTIDDVTF